MSDALINLEAEAVLLGAMLIENGLIDRVADTIDGSDFYEPVHSRIFDAIVRDYSLGKRVSPVSIKGYFEGDPALEELGGTAYLARLTADPMALVIGDSIHKQVAELSLRRRMREGLATAATACADLEATVGEIINHADAALNVTGKEEIHQPTGGECFDELLASLNEKTTGVTCGRIPALDDLLGPMRPKQLIIGAGRPGMGKTAFALSYAIGAAQNGHGVLFVSLEMSSGELAQRMAADLCFDTECQVPFHAIRDNRMSPPQFQKVREAAQYMHSLPFQVVDTGTLTIGRLNTLIRRHARRMAAAGNKLELVIVDYLQLLFPDQRARSNYEAVSEVSRGLKAMAKDHGVAILALAQLSREVEKRPDRRPQLSDLRDSGQIEQDADGVLFLLREEYYLRKAEPGPMTPEHDAWENLMAEHQGKIEFILAKRRNGVEGAVKGRFHGAYQAVRG